MCCVDRQDSLMMHKESPPSKNSFLEDLDKLDVSFHSQIEALINYSDVSLFSVSCSSCWLAEEPWFNASYIMNQVKNIILSPVFISREVRSWLKLIFTPNLSAQVRWER